MSDESRHARSPRGVSSLEQVEAILSNPAIYELAELLENDQAPTGGRRQTYPKYMLLAYESLITVYRSARRVEAELAHPIVWKFVRRTIRALFPDDESKWLPDQPMKRNNYLYGRNKYLVPNRERLRDEFEKIASRQASEDLGLCDDQGPGTLTHPDETRMLYADGKVVTPLWKVKPGTKRLNKETGEVTEARFEADAALHMTGSGLEAWGTKHVMVAARGAEPHARMILSVASVEKVGGEAAVATQSISRVADLLDGAQGVIYDGALRGTHIKELMAGHGLLTVSPVQARSGGRGRGKPRRERQVWIGDTTISKGSRRKITCQLYTEAGALHIGELDENGNVALIPLERIKLETRRNGDGTWRWYGIYHVPPPTGPATIRVRLDTSDEDRAAKFNRCEHLRALPPSDPDYQRLYPMRSDAESINRHLDDTMWLTRAHSAGRERQLVNLLGYAIAVNSLALHRHRRTLAPPGALAA